MKLYKVKKALPFTIIFNSNGGSAVENITTGYNTAITEPTALTKEGYKFYGWYSDSGLTNKYTFDKKPAENITLYAKWGIAYKILSGDNQTLKTNEDKNIVIKANGELEKLIGIKVDGTLIDESNYTLESGSTILTLKNEYLKTLSSGNHTVTFVYDDGEADATLNFENVNTEVKSNQTTSNPNTSDKIMSSVIMFTVSAIGLFGVVGAILFIKKRKNI